MAQLLGPRGRLTLPMILLATTSTALICLQTKYTQEGAVIHKFPKNNITCDNTTHFCVKGFVDGEDVKQTIYSCDDTHACQANGCHKAIRHEHFTDVCCCNTTLCNNPGARPATFTDIPLLMTMLLSFLYFAQ